MFSKISRGLAVLALVVGVAQFGIGVAVAMKLFTWERAATGAAVHWAELMSQGSYLIVFALGLGTLGEIGVALQRAFPKE